MPYENAGHSEGQGFPSENSSTEEWRWHFRLRIQSIQTDLRAIQESCEKIHTDMSETIDAIKTRIVPLEQLRSMAIGAGVVVIALTPLFWWLITKIATVIDRTPGGKP